MNTRLKQSWRCNVCGYVHIGPDAPIRCPKCGVGAEEFSAIKTQPTGLREDEIARFDALAAKEAGG